MAEQGEPAVKVGTRVLVKDKGLEGTVRYVGSAMFAPGKWIGVALGGPQGKNNGTVLGRVYFTCPENHGLFVRQNQVQVLSDSSPPRSRLPPPSNIPGPSGIPLPSGIPKRSSSVGKRSPTLPGKMTDVKKSPTPVRKAQSGSPREQHPREQKPPAVSVVPPATMKEQPYKPGPEAPLPSDSTSAEVVDLQQKLSILQQKRQEDKTKIKELEKYRAQLQQMMEYKTKWSEVQTDLQQQLKSAKKEAREAMLLKEKTEEEMRELSDAVEMATLDKEMAEERCESQQAENEALKEKVEELTIDLEIIKQEISETGLEGAASSAQLKQLEQQNTRLKEALLRLRDLSAEDKLEHQRVMKDLEKHTTALQLLKEHKDKVDQELQESHGIIDELQEQVDIALGAEEMVEKLTDKNLDLEEKIEQLNETVADLEALRDLGEEQEELRMEVEHELREELDLTQNNIRQAERRLDAAQETIVDQDQTIEKFRELVRHLQSDITELRQRGESQRTEMPETAQAQAAMMSLSQFKTTAIKTHSRTIEFELRKLDAQQAAEQINLLKSFMPNSFLISGGDYDALLVLMLLPRLEFKAGLIISQLKQQNNLEEALGSLSTVKGHHADQLAFVCLLIYRLSTLQLLIGRVNSILNECEVQLYCQMGGLRDDLLIHERALDILIEFLKKEQLDEGVPLHGVEKAIGHFENLLESRLSHEGAIGQAQQLLSQMTAMAAGCDHITLEMLRLRALAPDGSQFVTQLKELESFNNDLRLACRKIRRKVPIPGGPNSQRTVQYDTTVSQSLQRAKERQLSLTTVFRNLHAKTSQRAISLTDGETLTSGELEGFIQQATTGSALHRLVPAGEEKQPWEQIRSAMAENSTFLEKFHNSLQDGDYDAEVSKTKPEVPVVVRAKLVKAELSDVEGLGFKVEERQQDILELKKTLRMKAQELSEAGVKIGLLEKKVDTADSECAKKVAVEREEVQRFKDAMDEQESKFNRTIEILQGDIDALENEKNALEKRLDHQTKKTMLSDITVGRRTLGGRGSPYSSPYGSPFGSPFVGRKGVKVEGEAEGEAEGAVEGEGAEVAIDSPLLLGKVESLKKALSNSLDENFRLKTQIAKAQLNSLPPLHVPNRLIYKRRDEGEEEGGEESANQTDQEKSVIKETASLLEELERMVACPRVVDITKPKREPGKEGGTVSEPSPREKLANQIASVLEMRRRKAKVQEEGSKLLGSQFPGGVVSTRLASFTAPQFSKALNEMSQSVLSARIRLPRSPSGGCARRVVLSPAQFEALHTAVIS